MIILLPLRGWMGDAMAMEMALGSAASITTKTIANYPYSTADTGTFHINNSGISAPCPGHMDLTLAPVTHDEQPQDASTDDHCATCGVCQICHTVAVTVSPPFLQSKLSPHILRPVSGMQFASAPSAPGIKPPIF